MSPRYSTSTPARNKEAEDFPYEWNWEGITATRRALALGGYLPVPVQHRGKAVLMKDWQTYSHDPNTVMPQKFGHVSHTSTGIRCDGVIAIDIDIGDVGTRDQVREIVEAHLGDTDAVRWRDRSSKIALFYRPDPYFSTERTAQRFRLADTHKIEVYGNPGLQIVVHGEHADSTNDHRIFYRWENDPLWEVPLSALPPVTSHQVKDAITEVVETFPPADGAAASLRGEPIPPPEAVRNILAADDFHGSTVALAGHLAQNGMPPQLILDYILWVYDAVPVATLSPERRADWEVRRADVRRCVHDICKAELRKAESLYAEFLGAQAIENLKGNRRGK